MYYKSLLGLQELAQQTKTYLTTHPDDAGSLLMTLIYIEDIYDKGRGYISESARSDGYSPEQEKELHVQCNQFLDDLRSDIRNMIQSGDYQETITHHANQLIKNWPKF